MSKELINTYLSFLPRKDVFIINWHPPPPVQWCVPDTDTQWNDMWVSVDLWFCSLENNGTFMVPLSKCSRPCSLFDFLFYSVGAPYCAQVYTQRPTPDQTSHSVSSTHIQNHCRISLELSGDAFLLISQPASKPPTTRTIRWLVVVVGQKFQWTRIYFSSKKLANSVPPNRQKHQQPTELGPGWMVALSW